MNLMNKMLEESENVKQFAKNYFKYITKLLNDLDTQEIAAFAAEMDKARQNGNTIFFIGNGGSAATALHMVNDFGADIQKRTDADKPFRVVSLTNNPAVMLAVANDDGFHKLFVNQLRVNYRPGDKLVAISVSGNSANIIHAAEWVKAKGGTVIGLVGSDGGRLKAIADVVIHVKSQPGEFGPCEDIHALMGHLVSYWLQHQINKSKEPHHEYVAKT